MKSNRASSLMPAAVILALVASVSTAQQSAPSPEDHEKHHPDAAVQALLPPVSARVRGRAYGWSSLQGRGAAGSTG